MSDLDAAASRLRRQALADAWDEGARRVVDWNKAYPLVMPTDNPYRDKTPTICPECAAGKPWNCDGTAWDHMADQPTTCDGKKN